MKLAETLEENRNRTIESLDRFIELETGKTPRKVRSSLDFFYDAIRASRLELATEFPGQFMEANEDVDRFLSQTLVLFMDNGYMHNAQLVSKYLTDHMLN